MGGGGTPRAAAAAPTLNCTRPPPPSPQQLVGRRPQRKRTVAWRDGSGQPPRRAPQAWQTAGGGTAAAGGGEPAGTRKKKKRVGNGRLFPGVPCLPARAYEGGCLGVARARRASRGHPPPPSSALPAQHPRAACSAARGCSTSPPPRSPPPLPHAAPADGPWREARVAADAAGYPPVPVAGSTADTPPPVSFTARPAQSRHGGSAWLPTAPTRGRPRRPRSAPAGLARRRRCGAGGAPYKRGASPPTVAAER